MARKLGPPTPTMIDAINMAKANGGELVRYIGGYWAPRNAAKHPHNGLPIEYFGANTIHGLVLRGIAAYSERKQGRGGEFPIAIEISKQNPETI